MNVAEPSGTKAPVAETVRQMYNAHPFPNRRATPSSRSDERFTRIYEDFLHVPLAELAGKTMLDAGCGTGENTWSWRRILPPGARLIAVDLSRASVGIARAREKDPDLSPRFAVGSLLDLGLRECSVDLVFCSGVLVAVTDPERAFHELLRVLRPGGYMILVLYHRYGRALHGMRRAVIDLIEREDVDRRARLGGRLFGRGMRKLAEQENIPYEDILYDQFGLPCESRYSVGQALKWFREGGIDYVGTWPPVELSQFGNALRFSQVFRQQHPRLFRLLMRIFPENAGAPRRAPGLAARAPMEALWAVDQLQLFAISGRKRLEA